MRGSRMAASVAAGVMLALVGGSAVALAGTAEDGADAFNVAPGTAVSASSSMVVISVPSTVPAMVITCTSAGVAGKTGLGLRVTLGLPSLTDGPGTICKDNLNFTDSFQANSTNGSWMLIEKDFTNAGAGDEGLAEPNATGDRMMLHLPKAGLVDTNNWPCTLTFAPSAPASIGGAYNDAGTFKIHNASVPISMAGPAFCGPATQTVTITATFTVSPALFDQG